MLSLRVDGLARLAKGAMDKCMARCWEPDAGLRTRFRTRLSYKVVVQGLLEPTSNKVGKFFVAQAFGQGLRGAAGGKEVFANSHMVFMENLMS